MDIEPSDQCIVCGTLYNLQLCEECEEFVCNNKECLDPDSISIPTWICCLKCYQEKMSAEMETQMNDGYLDKCMYCGNTFYYEQICDCYAYLQEDIENTFIYEKKNNNDMILENIEEDNNIFVQNNNLENIIENLQNIKINK